MNFDLKKLSQQLEETYVEFEQEPDYQLLSDYAVILMKMGEAEVAADLLSIMNYYYPEEYKISSNLGTAYELIGELDSALKYIERGMELNPNAHGGSEWIHIKVLETKKVLNDHPDYLLENTVLQLTEEEENDTNTLIHLSIQLHERFPFTPSPDAIMASMITDLGDCFAATTSIEHAQAFYKIAKEYYGDTSAVINDKIKEIDRLRRAHDGIRPEIDRSEPRLGEHVVMGRIRYKDLLEENNDPLYEVDWSQFQLNADSLLAIAGLERPLPPVQEDTSLVTNDVEGLDEPNTKNKQGTSRIMYFLIAGAIFIPLLFVVQYYRRKK